MPIATMPTRYGWAQRECDSVKPGASPTSTEQLMSIHKMTTTSFAITLYGQCCRRHVVSQPAVSDISTVRSCWSICSLCSESYNASLLLQTAHCCTLLHLANITYNMVVCTWWPYIREFSDVTAPYLYIILEYTDQLTYYLLCPT